MDFFVFDFLISASFLSSLYLSFKVNKHLKSKYSEKFDIKRLFVPKHQEDKKYASFINWLRLCIIMMIFSIFSKSIFFVMNR